MAKNSETLDIEETSEEIRQRIPKKKFSLEDLGLINQNLFFVDGELARRYHKALKQVFDLECDVDNFRLDKRGLSPELCKYFKEKYPERFEYGDNYLNKGSANRFMVVVSPDQKSAPLIAPQASYDDKLCDEVYRQARHTIEDITAEEVLYGEFEDGIENYDAADDLLQFRTVEITLDTLEKTVKNFFDLEKLSDNLGQRDHSLDTSYIGKMQELVKKVGDIRRRSISKVFPITKEIHCFYVEFFKGIHCLRNFKNTEDIRAIFITHDQKVTDFGEEVVSTDLHNKKVLDILHQYKFLKYNKDLITQRLREIEDDTWLSEGIDVLGIEPAQRTTKVVEYIRGKKFPKIYNELREIKKIIGSTSIKFKDALADASYEARLKLSEPASKAEIIDHMLAELDPTDAMRAYKFNRRKLITEFPDYHLNKQRYTAYTILNKFQGGKIK